MLVGKQSQAILNNDPQLTSLFTKSYSEWKQLYRFLLTNLQLFLHDLHSIDIHRKNKQYEHNQIYCLTIFEETYPNLLKQIFDPPWVLYIKGRKELLNQPKTLAVVGTRKPTAYGLEALKIILPPLSKIIL